MRAKEKNKIKPNIAAPLLVCLTYVLLLFCRLLGDDGSEGSDGYLRTIVLQLIIFLLPSVIYCKLRGDKFSHKLRLSLLGAEQLLLTVLSSLLLICGSLILNIILSGGSWSGTSLTQVNGTLDVRTFIYITLAYAALPAFCEEFVFRAVLSAEYERYGILCSATMTTLFFAMLHFSFSQFVIYLFAGVVLYITMLATRSFFGAVIVHFLFNMYGLFGQGFANEVYQTTGSAELFVIIVFALFLLVLTAFCGEASRIYRGYANRNLPSDYRVKLKRGKARENLGKVLLTPVCLVCYLLFVIAAFIFR